MLLLLEGFWNLAWKDQDVLSLCISEEKLSQLLNREGEILLTDFLINIIFSIFILSLRLKDFILFFAFFTFQNTFKLKYSHLEQFIKNEMIKIICTNIDQKVIFLRNKKWNKQKNKKNKKIYDLVIWWECSKTSNYEIINNKEDKLTHIVNNNYKQNKQTKRQTKTSFKNIYISKISLHIQ